MRRKGAAPPDTCAIRTRTLPDRGLLPFRHSDDVGSSCPALATPVAGDCRLASRLPTFGLVADASTVCECACLLHIDRRPAARLALTLLAHKCRCIAVMTVYRRPCWGLEEGADRRRQDKRPQGAARSGHCFCSPFSPIPQRATATRNVRRTAKHWPRLVYHTLPGSAITALRTGILGEIFRSWKYNPLILLASPTGFEPVLPP